jgi:UDP-N-acetylmuramyl pentapeptide phosphotransferase/UDP-N-acetylglucosamine-1-phosphate transferase
LVPVVIRVVTTLRLFDHPNERSSAIRPIPTLGGIAIFLSFIFAVTLGTYRHEIPGMTFLFAAVLLMFFVGLKDDVVDLPPWKKLFAEIIAAGCIIIFANIRFTSFHGFLGINEIGVIPSFIITTFFIIVIINSINLIDGIDGLASGLIILYSLVFGCWFLFSGHIEYAILSFTLVGSTSGFFYYNVFGGKNKIFMGDTGSLVLGTILSIIVIKFNEFNISEQGWFAIDSVPVVSFGILIYPLADTLRVFIIRLLHKKSPFSPDKNHLHHRLLALGFSHKKASFTIILSNMLFIISVFSMHNIGILNLIAFIVIISVTLFTIPAYIIKKKNLILNTDPHQQLLSIKLDSKKRQYKNIESTVKRDRHNTQISKIQLFLQKLNIW